MNESAQQEWRTGLLQGFLWTDVLSNNGNVVAKVLTHKMTRPYASEPIPEGMANLALVEAAPKLFRICEALLPLAEAEAYSLDAYVDSPERESAALEAWAIVHAAQEIIKEVQP
jgi:hypothetical protein